MKPKEVEEAIDNLWTSIYKLVDQSETNTARIRHLSSRTIADTNERVRAVEENLEDHCKVSASHKDRIERLIKQINEDLERLKQINEDLGPIFDYKAGYERLKQINEDLNIRNEFQESKTVRDLKRQIHGLQDTERDRIEADLKAELEDAHECLYQERSWNDDLRKETGRLKEELAGVRKDLNSERSCRIPQEVAMQHSREELADVRKCLYYERGENEDLREETARLEKQVEDLKKQNVELSQVPFYYPINFCMDDEKGVKRDLIAKAKDLLKSVKRL
jgi:chromosome segregation ATPase